jgi:hypothetical protein
VVLSRDEEVVMAPICLRCGKHFKTEGSAVLCDRCEDHDDKDFEDESQDLGEDEGDDGED